MRVVVDHPRFVRQPLAVHFEVTGKVSLLLDGKALKLGANKTSSVLDDAGKPISLKLEGGLFSKELRVRVGGDVVVVTPPISRPAAVFAMLPLAFAIFGGAIGGLVGACAAMLNFSLMQREWPAAARYAAATVVTFIAFNMAAGASLGLRHAVDANKPVDDATLAEIAEATTRESPKVIDDDTRFDRAVATKRGLVLQYQIVTAERATIQIDGLSTFLRENVPKSLCPDPVLRRVLKANYRVEYTYRDRNGVEVLTETFTLADCPTAT